MQENYSYNIDLHHWSTKLNGDAGYLLCLPKVCAWAIIISWLSKIRRLVFPLAIETVSVIARAATIPVGFAETCGHYF